MHCRHLALRRSGRRHLCHLSLRTGFLWAQALRKFRSARAWFEQELRQRLERLEVPASSFRQEVG